MRRVNLVLVALALLLGGVGQAKADLIVNGGFETGDFAGWTANTIPSFLVEPSGHAGIPSHSGSYYLNIGFTTSNPGVLSQIISDTVGSSYTLSMYLLGDGGPNEFKVRWNGTTISDRTDIPDTLHTSNPYYIQLSFNVQGTGNDTLTLSGGDDGARPGALALDDVSLVPAGSSAVPQPASITLLGIGIACMAVGYGWRRRRPGNSTISA